MYGDMVQSLVRRRVLRWDMMRRRAETPPRKGSSDGYKMSTLRAIYSKRRWLESTLKALVLFFFAN